MLCFSNMGLTYAKMAERWGKDHLVLVLLSLLAISALIFLVDNAGWAKELHLLQDGTTTERLLRTARVGSWYGIAAFFMIQLTLLCTRRWWLLRSSDAVISDPVNTPVRPLFIAVLLIACTLTGALSWSRMDLSVYNDEEYSLRTYIRGRFEDRESGEPKFKPVTWAHTLWANPLGNNHVLFSMASRVSLTAWRTLTGANERAFSEVAFRFPSWIAGVLAVGLMGLLLAQCGYERSALFAMMLASVHPWYLRYTAEGRGYALMFLFLVASWYFLIRALQENRWSWWLLHGVTQALMLLAYAGSLYASAVTGLATLVFCLWKCTPRWLWVSRLLVANAITVSVLSLVQGPWIIAQLEHMASERMNVQVKADYLPNFWSYLSTGMLLQSDSPGNPAHITIASLTAQGIPAGFILWVLLPLVILAGALRLILSNNRFSGLLIALLLLPAPVGFIHAWMSHTYLFIWYLIFALPGFLMLAAVGLSWPLSLGALKKISRPATIVFLFLVTVFYAAFTWQQIQVIRTHTKENSKAAIEFVRGSTNPSGDLPHESILTGSFWIEASFYDPHIYFLKRPRHFVELLRKAHSTGLPMFIVYGNRDVARKRNPGNFIFVENPALFAQVAEFPGLEEALTTIRVVRYTGADPEPHIPDPIPER